VTSKSAHRTVLQVPTPQSPFDDDVSMGVTILDVVTQPADNCGHLMHGGQQSDIRMARARGDTAPNNGFTRRRFAARPSRMTA
jgi:hypothetical protein